MCIFRIPIFVAIFLLLYSCNSTEKEKISTFSPPAVKKILAVYSKIDKKLEIGLDEIDLVKRQLVEPIALSIHPNSIPNYQKIGAIISYIGDEKLISDYINFIIRTDGSDDDSRAFGFAEIYKVYPEKVLKLLSLKEVKDRKGAITSLAWGLLNIFEGKMNYETAKYVIVGNKKELYNDSSKNKDIAFEILKKVRLRLK